MIYKKRISHSDNVDFIKYIAAIMVIIGHSFVIATTNLGKWSAFFYEYFPFGATGVAIFFFFSGFLVTKSMLYKKNAKNFFETRIYRIFPPLIVVVIATVFFLGTFTTNLSIKEYLLNPETYKYLLNVILVRQHYLPGVFEDNPYPRAVNGSLWTLLFEFLCYIFTYIAYELKLLKKKRILFSIPIVIIGLAMMFVMFPRFGMSLDFLGAIVRPCTCYYVGMLMAFYYEYWINSRMLFISIILTILGFAMRSTYIVLIFCVPVLLLNIGWGISTSVSPTLAKFGKYSYGIYLVAFPIQQLLVHLAGEMNPYVNSVLAILLSTLLGRLIYKYIELPFAIRLHSDCKNKLDRKRT